MIKKSKAILFVNGRPPRKFPLIDHEEVYCTDGAYAYVIKAGIVPTYIVGDMDSVNTAEIDPHTEIHRMLDQNYTDYDKALMLLMDKSIAEVEVYGAGGKEQDHFLGNLSATLRYKQRLNVVFKDDHHKYFFAPKNLRIQAKPGQIISLLPFPVAKKVVTKGLKYPLKGEDLELGVRIGTRNEALTDEVLIEHRQGALIVFIHQVEN